MSITDMPYRSLQLQALSQGGASCRRLQGQTVTTDVRIPGAAVLAAQFVQPHLR
jgi:hypothetical protein